MKLIQLFLPVYDNRGQLSPKVLFDKVREELTNRFGGVTAFVRSPAVGLWEDDSGAVCRDDVVLFEVMVETVEHDWWARFRHDLEAQFSQDAILIRASDIDLL